MIRISCNMQATNNSVYLLQLKHEHRITANRKRTAVQEGGSTYTLYYTNANVDVWDIRLFAALLRATVF